MELLRLSICLPGGSSPSQIGLFVTERFFPYIEHILCIVEKEGKYMKTIELLIFRVFPLPTFLFRF